MEKQVLKRDYTRKCWRLLLWMHRPSWYLVPSPSCDGTGRIGEDPHGIPNNLMPFVAQVGVLVVYPLAFLWKPREGAFCVP